MLGTALKLLAVGRASRQVGGYIQKLLIKYLVLALAGTIFLAAVVFAILAAFWQLRSTNHSPVESALLMAVILVFIGLLIGFLAYGITREKKSSVSNAMPQTAFNRQGPEIPSAEEVGHRIEHAVSAYGPLKVVAAAAAGGVLIGFLTKRFS